jgi:hypothetical protein
MADPGHGFDVEIVLDHRGILMVTGIKKPCRGDRARKFDGSAKPTQSLFNAFSAFTVGCCCTSGKKTNRFLAELDLKLIAWFEVQHGCVSLAD